MGQYNLTSCVYLTLVRSQTEMSANCFKSVTVHFSYALFWKRNKGWWQVRCADHSPAAFWLVSDHQVLQWLLAAGRQKAGSSECCKTKPVTSQSPKAPFLLHKSFFQDLSLRIFESNASPAMEGCNTIITFNNSGWQFWLGKDFSRRKVSTFGNLFPDANGGRLLSDLVLRKRHLKIVWWLGHSSAL